MERSTWWVNKEFRIEVLRCLRNTKCRMTPELWENQSWMLHDNTPANVLLLNWQNNTIVLFHTPYSQETWLLWWGCFGDVKEEQCYAETFKITALNVLSIFLMHNGYSTVPAVVCFFCMHLHHYLVSEIIETARCNTLFNIWKLIQKGKVKVFIWSSRVQG